MKRTGYLLLFIGLVLIIGLVSGHGLMSVSGITTKATSGTVATASSSVKGSSSATITAHASGSASASGKATISGNSGTVISYAGNGAGYSQTTSSFNGSPGMMTVTSTANANEYGTSSLTTTSVTGPPVIQTTSGYAKNAITSTVWQDSVTGPYSSATVFAQTTTGIPYANGYINFL